MSNKNNGGQHTGEPLAIVGIGCRFPGGVVDSDSFWQLLATGGSGIVEVPKDRWTLDRHYHPNAAVSGKMQSRWGGFVENLDRFDAQFWGITPREAMRMDPQQRWLLEIAWEALEDSGTPPRQLRGQNVGVFVGISTHDYSGIQGESIHNSDAHTNSGITLSIASNRISYLLDLKGPSLSVDTACSSSLVALSVACRSIWAGECDAALVGGVNAMCTPHPTVGFSKASMLSPDGQCFAFDARANGYVRGEGAGIVYFKRLSKALQDNDTIYSVIRAAVINQDGNTSSMAVPAVDAQATMLRRAYSESGIDASQVVYMEGHGTGTPIGDPIEAAALGRVLSTGRDDSEPCLLGSVKSNIGHLEAGSGIAGLIKAALVLHNDQVPPNANYRNPNPNIPFDELKLKVATDLRPLPRCNGRPSFAAVNSFGFGGTNAHAVLEAVARPVSARNATPPIADRPFVLPVSARSRQSLTHYVQLYLDFLQSSDAPLGDIAYSAGAHKEHHQEQVLFVGRDVAGMCAQLSLWLENEARDDDSRRLTLPGIYAGRAATNSAPIVFVFTGQGAQWWAMGQQLLQREPVVRHTLQRIDGILAQYKDYSLIEEMSRSEADSRIHETHIAQVAIFGLQVALAQLWKSWGVVPTTVVGHSVGEVAAAFVAGIYSLDDAVKIIYHRSRLQHTTRGQGKMLAVGLSPTNARALIGERSNTVQIAAVNSSYLVTLAGETRALTALTAELESQGAFYKWLPVDYPFHTRLMDPIRRELLDSLADIRPQAGSVRFVSTVTGSVYPGERMDADYWWANVRNPVLFAPAVVAIARGGDSVFVEVGPHPALKGPVSDCLAAHDLKGAVLHSLRRNTDETQELFASLAGLVNQGVPVQWSAVNQSAGNFVRLPRYPWQRERFWLECEKARLERIEPDTHPLLGLKILAGSPTWECRLDPRVFSYLESHRFWGSILFPAAGYGEIALALARAVFPDQQYTVEDLVVKKALFVNDETVPVVRTTFNETDKSFVIQSSTDMMEWDLHVEGRLTHYQSPTPGQIDLDVLRARLPLHAGHDQYYQELDEAGFHFGPHFRLVQNVHHIRGEALVEVVTPTGETRCEPDYHCHPMLLDACLQVGKAAIDAPANTSADKTLYLPRRLGRIRFYRSEMPGRFWAHGKQTAFADDSIEFDITVYDENGMRVADILGFVTEPMQHIRDDDDVESHLYHYGWHAVAGLDAAGDAAGLNDATGLTYALVMDAGGTGERVAQQLAAQGATLVRISNDDEATLKRTLAGITRLDGIIHCGSLDHPDDPALGMADVEAAQQTGVLSALRLSRALGQAGLATQVYLLTRGAQAAASDDRLTRPWSAAAIGLARVAANENPDVRWRLIDLDATCSERDAQLICDELAHADDETEVAYRADKRLVKRIQRVRATDFPPRLKNAVQSDGSVIPYHLQIDAPGILSNLSLNETRRRDPGPGEIEARVVAAGINFRNVMKALGMPIGNTVAFPGYGEDFAGTVLRVGAGVSGLKPGDDILGMGAGTFRAYVTTDCRAVFKKPEALSFTEAATIPTVFSTAYYALVRLANMRRGEKILIHAGTGGVGQAAIQIARSIGLEIFATAGTPEKRELLLQLGAHHAMNSRTLDFVDDVMRITDGTGVDCVLNSLAADFIPKSLSVLAPFGRFVEIGKVDIHNNSKIGMALLKNNISYFMFDLIDYIVRRTDHIAEMFVELGAKFEQGHYQPIQHSDFPITCVEAAYRLMAQGKHVGKNVLTFDVDNIPVAPCNEDGHLFRREGTYLITGGASGFGLEVARWMAMHGAGHLVLMSRNGPRDETCRASIDSIRLLGARVSDARGDVTDPADVQRIVDQISTDKKAPLLGVIHGAMVLHDEFIAGLDEETFTAALRPKINGAWNLHQSTRNLPLEHFVCFSSFSAAIGAPKQSNYNAGNVFLEALAHHRRGQGLPALTISWGALSGAGFVARNKTTAAYLDAIGMKSLNVEEALRVFRRLLLRDTPQVLATRADWTLWSRIIPHVGRSKVFAEVTREHGEASRGGSIGPRVLAAAAEERGPILETFIADNLAAVCSIDAANIDPDVALTNLGLDSLMAVELMNRIESDIGVAVPMGKVLAGPSVRELASILLDSLVGSGDVEGTATASAVAASTHLAPLQRSDRALEFSLSARQESLWQDYRRMPPSAPGIVAFAARVQPRLQADVLVRALANVTQAHPMLRARFTEREGRVTQTLGSAVAIDWCQLDDAAASKLPELAVRRAFRHFDLQSGPAVRVEILNVDAANDMLILACHEIVADRRSAAIVMNDLLASYSALLRGDNGDLPQPAHTFQDYVAWEHHQLESDAARRHYDYWRDELDGASAMLTLPARCAPGSQRHADANGLLPFRFDAATSLGLSALAAEQETTPRAALLTAFQVLLHATCRQRDILIGCELPGRQHDELEFVVGPLSNTCALRSSVDDDPTFAQLLARTVQRLSLASVHQHYPLQRVLGRMQVPTVSGRAPAVQACFDMTTPSGLDSRGLPAFLPGQSWLRFDAGNVVVESEDITPAATQADLILSVVEASGHLQGTWRYNSDMLDAAAVRSLQESLESLVAQVVRNPLTRMSALHFPHARPFACWRAASDMQHVIRSRPDDVDPVAEAQLDESLAAGETPCEPERFDRVLLTGGTGFVGAFLIDELLRTTDADIVCLVRAGDDADALRRVLENLSRYGLSAGPDRARLTAVAGDLTRPRLGLSKLQFEVLANQVDAVYHSGADVNLAAGYAALKAVNVGGTREILRFAMHSRVKPTHIVSTYSVYLSQAHQYDAPITERDALPDFGQLQNGYAKTKWVVETMAVEARRRGLPVSIYRPGNITGHSETGAANINDIMHTLMRGVLHVGSMPDLTVGIDLTPVDYVAGAVVQLSRSPQCLGGDFNLLNREPLRLKTLASCLAQAGRPVATVTLEQWRAALARVGNAVSVEVLELLAEDLSPQPDDTSFVPRAFLTSFDCSKADTALADTAVRCHPVNAALLTCYLAGLERTAYFDRSESAAGR